MGALSLSAIVFPFFFLAALYYFSLPCFFSFAEKMDASMAYHWTIINAYQIL